MRMPRLGSRTHVSLAFASLAIVLALLGGGAAAAADESPSGAAGWKSLLGNRPTPQLGNRWIVVLDVPSLATRVAAAGGVATEEQERSWTRSARKAQEEVIGRLALKGVPIEPEHSYYRTFNGFAAPLDARALAIVAKNPAVLGAYAVRAAIPAAVDPNVVDQMLASGGERRADVQLPGFSGAGVTVALLDTGVDRVHPYIRRALLPGLDVLDPGGDASARQNPTAPGRPERHGTEMAGLVVGSDGPAGLEGTAPGASLLPIRVAGWQPDVSGGVAIYGRTDQVLAGLELAVDPNEDGDAHDAVRVALVGVVEPFAAFADGPLSVAAAGATALDTLVVAPAGNDGPAGPAYGSIGGPGGAPAVLTAGALDTRRRSPTGHVLLLAGLRTLVSGSQPLGGVVAPGLTTSAQVVALQRAPQAVVGAAGGFSRLFDSAGYSRVAGAAVLLPRGTSSPEAVREVVAAGATAVLVDGALPAGSLGTDGPVDVPILGLSASNAEAVRSALRQDVPVRFSVGAASFNTNPDRGAPAPFSSEGLAFNGAQKPELNAAGVGLATSDPGRDEDGAARYGTLSGSSAAAALTAGAAALLAQARPDLDAAGLKQALVASARRVPGSVVGTVDPSGAAAIEVIADPSPVTLGAVFAEDTEVGRVITLRNTSSRPITVAIRPGTADSADIEVDVAPSTARLRPGGKVQVAVTARVPLLPRAPAALRGALAITVQNGAVLKVPWTISVPVVGLDLIRNARLSSRTFAPSDVEPAVLTLTLGRVDGRADRPQLLPLEQATIELYRGDRLLGQLALVRDLLPGRYSFGITGRGPNGRRLPTGEYALRVTAIPVGGGFPNEEVIPFSIE
ncbi:S8 family serine peptidase [Gaiella sp.]|uniref:S8 family peptidase n=1 Tax=Gaiella sp. TaxID=2663207 RepID=UPI00326418AF